MLPKSTPIPTGTPPKIFRSMTVTSSPFSLRMVVSAKCSLPADAKVVEWVKDFLSIYGTEGTIWKNHIHHSDGRTEEIVADDGDAIQETVSHFVDCVINGTQPLIDVREGAKTVSGFGRRCSAETGKPGHRINSNKERRPQGISAFLT